MLRTLLAVVLALAAVQVAAQEYPTRKEGSWTARDFRFHTGEVLPEVRFHYTTLGDPKNDAVLVLHGTTGTGAGMLNPGFGGELFGPGQPLDAARYFIILPDAIGHGKSSKPSDGLRAKFPRYNYDDMVQGQYLVVTQALGLKRLRLAIGNSMGGMNVWLWGVKHPEFADALVPMASMPIAMSGRNYMMRRLIVDSIRNDPDWKGGDYAAQPKSALFAQVYYGLATNGGNQALQRIAGTREAADKLLDQRLGAKYAADANDNLYQWDASRDYNPQAGLDRIQAHVLAINSADDERNPPELGVMERELKRVKNGRLLLIPASDQTAGHGTTGQAKWWKNEMAAWLKDVPRRGP
jgi:homoserine O-acetyltransferase